MNQFVVNDLDEGLARREALRYLFANRAFPYMLGEGFDDRQSGRLLTFPSICFSRLATARMNRRVAPHGLNATTPILMTTPSGTTVS